MLEVYTRQIECRSFIVLLSSMNECIYSWLDTYAYVAAAVVGERKEENEKVYEHFYTWLFDLIFDRMKGENGIVP